MIDGVSVSDQVISLFNNNHRRQSTATAAGIDIDIEQFDRANVITGESDFPLKLRGGAASHRSSSDTISWWRVAAGAA